MIKSFQELKCFGLHNIRIEQILRVMCNFTLNNLREYRWRITLILYSLQNWKMDF